MYIKQVIIEGFKSYKEQVATEPFSPKVNCIVGANGSGKSNFFQAIRFVISDLFQHLPSEDRHKLLHEGAGRQMVTAFVEIVFDNSDNRIPVVKEEVRLRRKISLKKDEYFLDGKHISKTEVMNLLESAGFSRSNPYYVVQQGKIMKLTTMGDQQRLGLLKEIGGSHLYEERRSESLKIMQETGKKRNQIIQIIQYLDERLRELDEERAELKNYQQLDNKRKYLEYAIYDKELHNAREEVAEVEEAWKKVSEKSTERYKIVSDAVEKSKELDKSSKDLTKVVQSLNREKEELQKQQADAIKKRSQLEHDEKDLKENISGNINAKEDATKQLELLQREIQDSTKELNKIKSLYDKQIREEEDITRGIMERENQLNVLYQKRGRSTEFSSKAARDKWLQDVIDDYERALSSNLMQEKKLKDEIDQLKTELDEDEAHIKGLETESAVLQSVISRQRDSYNQYRSQRDKLNDERKYLWRKENELSNEIDRLKTEVIKAEKQLHLSIPSDIRRGVNSVKRIHMQLSKGKSKGECLPIFDILDCDEKFFTAVEIAAGNSLFHVVVENDEMSTRMIRDLDKEQGGRVTFIPLNRVKTQQVTYPQSSDVIPLLKKLKFPRDYTPAFEEVFARTVICRNLDVATRVARTYHLDCITLEGDQVSKNGCMTGGFYDYRLSKLKLRNIIKHNTESINKKKNELQKVEPNLTEIDQKISELVAEQQKADAKLAYDKSELEQLKQDTANANKQKHSISKVIEKKRKLLVNVLTQIDQLKTSITMKRDEMGTELVERLTPVEKDSLSLLNTELREWNEKLSSCRKNRLEVETRKEELQTNLSTNLARRKQELEAIKFSEEPDILHSETELKRKELRGTEILLEDVAQQLKRVSESIEEQTMKLNPIKAQRDDLKTREYDYRRALLVDEEELERLIRKKNNLVGKQEKYSKKIRELGPLSLDALDTYKRKSVKDLYDMLHKCYEQLQKFNHVNKKALDQYANFLEQREEFQKRKEELIAGDEKIKELISTLDQRKDESIERTFKGVAKHFREAFSELVQGGHAMLIMKKKKDGGQDDDDYDDNNEPLEPHVEGRVEKYIGVKVKVSFTGQGETQSMKQLSGGQKTVVALALIFAIQRCDPAPFYLFDEIDAALDPQYRTAVANMVERLANTTNTQLIATTFRQELVSVADKIYGVTHGNRVSRVGLVTKEEALKFIEHDHSHNVE